MTNRDTKNGIHEPTTHELRVTELRAGVPGREVLRGIDLVVPFGEVHAVMGPNGSGKSTLAHVIMGRPGYEVLGGSITLDGIELLDLPTWQRPGLASSFGPSIPHRSPGGAAGDGPCRSGLAEHSIRR